MRLPIVAVLLALTLATPVWADEVTDQIGEARKLYERGKYSEAVKELQFVINEIHGKLSGRFVGSLPPAPPGWTAEEVETQGMAMMGGGQVITRAYREESGEGSVKAQLVVDSPMIQGLAMMLNNPAMLGAQGRMKRVRIKRENALLKWNRWRRSGELSVILGNGRLLIQIEGRDVTKEVLTRLMKSWDFDKAKRIAGL